MAPALAGGIGEGCVLANASGRRINACKQRAMLLFLFLGDSCFEIVDHVEYLHPFEPLMSLCASILDNFFFLFFPFHLIESKAVFFLL